MLDPLELVLQVFVSGHVGAGNSSQAHEPVSVLNHRAISAAFNSSTQEAEVGRGLCV